jgi:secondary thiamine-phosphate synthase enzyme
MKIHDESFQLHTERRCEMIDITNEVEIVVCQSQITDGEVTVYCPHTTAAITINENADPDVLYDMTMTLNELFPQNRRGYRHAEGNSDSHVKSSLFGCSGATTTESAARTGALIGGMSDGWAGAATGAILGGVLGSAVDHADDRKAREERKQRELAYKENIQRQEASRLARMQQSSITADPKTAYRPEKRNALVGGTWRIISLVDESGKTPEFKNWVISFQTNSKATTLVMWDDGRVETFVETYSVTGEALIFSGKLDGKSYVTNSKFSVQNGQMVVVTPDVRVVLEEVEESA